MLNRPLNLVIKKFSPLIYRTLGPQNAFRLAMSPFGLRLFRFLTREKKDRIKFKTKYNFLIETSLYEYYMSGYLFLRETNPLETRVVRTLLNKGDVMIDVGAHIGWYTLNAAQKVGSKGHVFAFEPNPECLDYLKRNLKLNQYNNVILEPIALCNRNGRVNFWLGDDMGGSMIKENTQRLSRTPLKKIKAISSKLDSYCLHHKIKKTKLIKIDVEGAEMQVLKGAIKVLKQFSPALIIEVLESNLRVNKSSKKELLKFLEKNGYQQYFFTTQGLKKVSYNDLKEKPINAFYTKDKKAIQGLVCT